MLTIIISRLSHVKELSDINDAIAGHVIAGDLWGAFLTSASRDSYSWNRIFE